MKDKKKQIMNCSHELFKEKGYWETSIQDILDACSVSKGTFYKYFSSKGSLTLELFRQLESQLDSELHAILLSDDNGDKEGLIRKVICSIKQFEHEYGLRPILGEAIVEKDPELIVFFKEIRQKYLLFLYELMKAAFGARYSAGVMDATLFLQALVKELSKMNALAKQPYPIETIVDYCFHKMLLCFEEMNNRPLFESELLMVEKHSQSDMERFMDATLRLSQWLKKEFAHHPKKDLYLDYLHFLTANKDNLDQYPAITEHIVKEFEQHLVGHYQDAIKYIQILKAVNPL